MDAPRSHTWVPAALLFGAAYFLIGRLFTLPADHVRLWRLAAWIASGGVYAAHIWYEHFRLRSPARSTALHIAVAVAIGGFTLAVAGMIHSLATTSAIRPTWLLALVIFPAVTAVPAYVGALVAVAMIRRILRTGAD